MTKFIVNTLFAAGLAAFLVACRESSMKLEVGGVYSINNGGGQFGVAKLLDYGDGICHVRVYAQKFSTRPATIDIPTLTLGRLDDSGGSGLGHLPLREAGFLAWQPVLIARTKVTPDELDGYKMWKEAGGGAF
jgi:hypothetical protein